MQSPVALSPPAALLLYQIMLKIKNPAREHAAFVSQNLAFAGFGGFARRR
jgi:hypothetical protein